ncbi:hypothetical protein E2C01_073282 [Portunus trituberculatus]|uniref:Uncharacterized protein n=1 Tax=Portunus trituberculatus TaxID=210409 RepID=A0A5B7I9E6_PORTR|nr:hypothetical protein [Portunus trituberculatus]
MQAGWRASQLECLGFLPTYDLRGDSCLLVRVGEGTSCRWGVWYFEETQSYSIIFLLIIRSSDKNTRQGRCQKVSEEENH